MIDAAVGALIMVVATTALALAVEVSEQAFRSAGRYAPTASERAMLMRAGWSSEQDRRNLQADLDGLPQ